MEKKSNHGDFRLNHSTKSLQGEESKTVPWCPFVKRHSNRSQPSGSLHHHLPLDLIPTLKLLFETCDDLKLSPVLN